MRIILNCKNFFWRPGGNALKRFLGNELQPCAILSHGQRVMASVISLKLCRHIARKFGAGPSAAERLPA